MKLNCSFCGEVETPNRKLVAGPAVFICGECARIALEVLAEHYSDSQVFCAMCHVAVLPGESLIFRGKGYLCVECVRAIRAATDDALNSP